MKRIDHDLRGLQRSAHFARLLAVLALCLASFQVANAGTDLVPANPAYQRFVAQMGPNAAMMYYGVGGKVLPSASGLAQYASVAGLSPTAGEISRYAALQTKYGQVPFKVSQTITAVRLAKGVAAVAGGPLGIGLLALSATADWLSDAGLSVDAQSGVLQRDPAICTQSPCVEYAYTTTVSGVIYSTGWIYGKQAACQATVTLLNGPAGGVYTYMLNGVINDTTSYDCSTSSRPDSWTSGWQSTSGKIALTERTVAPSAPVWIPADLSTAETKLASTSRTAAEIEKLLSELAQYPEVTPDPADLTRIDPATPGQPIKSTSTTSTSTTTNPDGSKTTQTKTCEIKGTVKATSTLALSEVCVTDTVTTSPSGDVTGTSTTSTESDDPDAAAPGDDSDFCASLVGKLVCADLDTPDGDEVPTASETITYATESHFGGGSCPADAVMTLHNGQQLTVWDWAGSCVKINQYFRPIFLALCAFTALMILAPGVKEGA